MNPRTLSQLLLGLLGVSALVRALGLVEVAPAEWHEPVLIIGTILQMLLLLVVSYLLVFHNGRMSQGIVKRLDASSLDTLPQQPSFLIRIVGVFFLIQAVTRLVGALPQLFSQYILVVGFAYPVILGYGGQTALALFLVLRPTWVAALWHPPEGPSLLVGLSGVFVLASVLPALIGSVVFFKLPAVVGNALQVAVALFLILRPGQLASLWRVSHPSGAA